MPYDGIVLNHVVQELQTLVGQRVDKLYQPETDEIHIQFRSKEKRRLKISINASMPYLTLTKIRKKNQDSPPNFLILIRKYLQGAFLEKIEQVGYDRVVQFSFLGKNELGDVTQFTLIYELMGKHSNLILINSEGIIIDSLKRVPPYMSQVRQILPTLTYEPLEATQKNIYAIHYSEFESLVLSNEEMISKMLYRTFQGFSPAFSKEVLFRLGIDPGVSSDLLTPDVISKLFIFLQNFKSDGYYIFKDRDGFFKDFHIVKLSQFDKFETKDSILELIDDFYATKDLQLRIKQHSSDLRKLVDNRIKRSEKKLASLYSDYNESMTADEYKLKGELIISNLHLIKKGMESARVLNYYDQTELEIKLNENKSPQENSQVYYKKYNKMKTAKDYIESQIKQAKDEVDYLNSITNSIQNSLDEDNLDMIKNELINQGYMKKKGFKKEKKIISKPHCFISKTGFEILVGKNNVENDQLTFKKASNSDIWLHTKDIPGSHVIISTKGQSVDDETLLLAAEIAAYYSKSKYASKVPVDYTEVRHVKKPSGSKPGFVNYFHQQTLIVTPDEDYLMNTIKRCI